MDDDQRTPRSALAVWLIVAALPVTYVLSIGPAFLLCKHGYLSEVALYLYLPLYYLHLHCEPFRVALDWYGSLWGL
jgi:hypothetical protein